VSNRDLWIWLFPALFALLSYGVGQGLVKKWVGDVSPARFCFYFLLAKSVVNLGYFFLQDHPPFLEEGVSPFLMSGVFAYILDGLGWVLYFESILLGPITMVGTLSAAYPALTVLLASRFFGRVVGTCPIYRCGSGDCGMHGIGCGFLGSRCSAHEGAKAFGTTLDSFSGFGSCPLGVRANSGEIRLHFSFCE